MRRRRDAVIALSLSNLVFFKVWAAYFYSYHRPYFRQDVAPGLDYLAILLDVLLLAALFWVGAQLARRSAGAALLPGARGGGGGAPAAAGGGGPAGKPAARAAAAFARRAAGAVAGL